MGKSYRLECRVTNGDEITTSFDLICAANEQDARAKFHELEELRLRFLETRAKLSGLRSTSLFKIVAVDEIDVATITERPEGAHLSTIPLLTRLPRTSLVIRPTERGCCEWGWVNKVLWDEDGNELHDSLSVVGCRSYTAIPPRWPPFYIVESVDDTLGVCLCPQHLAENFPQWKKMRLGAFNVSILTCQHERQAMQQQQKGEKS